MITLVLGGTRSGKSEVAESLAAGIADRVTYVATGSPSDADMAARIAAHRARRPAGWATVEAAVDLPDVLAAADGPAIVDSLGTWVAAHADLAPHVAGLWRAPGARGSPTPRGARVSRRGAVGGGRARPATGPTRAARPARVHGLMRSALGFL